MFYRDLKSRGLSPDTWPTGPYAALAKIRRYSARLSKIILLLFNTLITKHSFIAEKLETIFILPFFSPTHEMTYITGYLLTTDEEYSVHLDHIWAVLQYVE